MLKNEYFVFIGTLTTMTRKQALITGLNGHNQNSVTKKTTRLITGYFPIDLLKGYQRSHKLLEAEKAIKAGQKIIIMNEKEFSNFLAQLFQLRAKNL